MEYLARPINLELAALTLFAAALDRTEDERSSWLDAECGTDSALRARVRELISADAASLTRLRAPGSATQPSFLPPPEVGVYRLEELIGAGGMGSVYRARRNDGLFDQTVAIKFIRPLAQITAPFVDAERKLLARMEHAGIARILDGGLTANGLHFLVMEFVSGVALDRHVAEHHPDMRSRVDLLRQVCVAVGHAHQHLVVHCDIKPANILVTSAGNPKLIDFGVARIQNAADARPEGFTRAYTSPQRLAGAAAAVTDDVYSLGVVLHEILTSRLPHSGSELVGLPMELAAIVRQAMAPELAQRYANVTALENDLRNWLEHRPVSALGNGWRYRTRKLVERHPWRVAAASLAVMGLVSALAVIALLYMRADAARRDAEHRFGQLRALANYMLFDLDKRLEVTPGTTQTRREMVGRSQTYLDGLAATAGNNAELQSEVAVGLARLAEVQGVPGKAHVNEPIEAKANLERAERMLVRLTDANPHKATWQRDLGRVRYLLALVYGGVDNDHQRQLTKAREAQTHLLAALGTGWQISNAELGELHALLMSARLTEADVYRWREQYAAAAAIQRQEEQRMLRLPDNVRRAMEFEYQSGRPAVMLGDSLFYLNRMDEALRAYRRAVDRFELGLEKTPRHRKLLEGVLIGYWSIAGTLDEMGKHTEALVADDRAVTVGDDLVELDPQNTEALRMRDMARGQRALTLASLGRHDDAIRMVEQSLVEKQARAQQAPDDAERARDVAVPLRNLARLYQDKGDQAAACRVLEKALATWSQLDRRWGLNQYDRNNELGVVEKQFAACRRRGQQADAGGSNRAENL